MTRYYGHVSLTSRSKSTRVHSVYKVDGVNRKFVDIHHYLTSIVRRVSPEAAICGYLALLGTMPNVWKQKNNVCSTSGPAPRPSTMTKDATGSLRSTTPSSSHVTWVTFDT
ncbi:hypothetical protein Bbelb_065760 [Branchiostoma belcheri]|nr:hypothetical protein Bbelb_065760 [Branchiostoma belcheri]